MIPQSTADASVAAMPDDIDDNVSILQFVTASHDGKDFWAYLAMKPSRYEEYCARVLANEMVNLHDYGEVLEEGWGSEAPPEIQEKMAREYGAEPDFEEKLLKAVSEARNENLKEVGNE